MKPICLSALFFWFLLSLHAQTFSILEQNPTSIRWNQLQTPRFRIIYPRGLDSIAQYTANLLQTNYASVSHTLGKQPRKLSVVLQNQTTISNGFVTMFPRHSEFFTTPPQDPTLAGTNNWLGLLSVHEFRHVVQYDKMLTGFTKGAYWIFGNNALGVISLTVPNWFWEGDAVSTETALTSGGRGRIPRFDLEFRTRLLTGSEFSYSKATCRSYKDYIPNHYVSGYFLSSYLRRHYEGDAWGKILTRHYKFPLEPFSFSGAIRKETGMKVEQLYHEAAKELAGLWRNQLNQLNETQATLLPTARNKVMTNYEFPQYLDNTTIVCRKSGIGDIETYVSLKKMENGKAIEEKLFTPGIVEFTSHASNPSNGMLSVADSKIVWTEHGFDPRWNMRDYAVIKLYDLSSQKIRRITRRTKLFAPSLSPDGKTILAVEYTAQNQSSLQLLDTQTGQIVQTDLSQWLNEGFNASEHPLFQLPRFSSDGNYITSVILQENSKSIVLFDLKNRTKQSFPFGDENVSHPVKHGEYIYYNSPFTGIDNIYALHAPTGKKYQVTSRKFGAYNATISPDGKEIAFNDFTPNGFRIATMQNDPSSWQPLEDLANRTVSFYRPLLLQEGEKNLLRMTSHDSYTIKPYSKLANLINPYSWGPVVNSTGSDFFVGISSQDILSTTAIQTGIGYDANQRTASYIGNISYQGLYPVLDLNVSSGSRSGTGYVDRKLPLDSTRTDIWRETSISGGVRLPLTFTRSKFRESLVLSVYSGYTKVTDYDFTARSYSEQSNGSLYDMRYALQYNRLRKQALRDVFPRWGQTLTSQYRHTLPGSDFTGTQYTVQGGLFFPGLAKHHGFLLRGNFKYEDVSATRQNYRFAAPIVFVRGQSYTNSTYYTGVYADYRFPIFYPDWTLGRWFYIQRIKGNLFADYGRLSTGNASAELTSIGVDISADFNFMRLLPQLELGFRTVYRLQLGDIIIQPLVIDIGF
ncbi:hypothetical protein [Xanthocytophaga agilis]|uniref:Uncharacterized protein n=1 Tax=Xanthocytophaga agilis TaxID=3048010 RepID=A0AAE3UE60_9BACT|nr:hypothetical protein [Xanthocytophaga agilis]MDJ1499113.1 hypothetical protein [Xanthocytophaga agilis]